MAQCSGQNVLWVDASLAGAESKHRPFEILASYDDILWESFAEPLARYSLNPPCLYDAFIRMEIPLPLL